MSVKAPVDLTNEEELSKKEQKELEEKAHLAIQSINPKLRSLVARQIQAKVYQAVTKELGIFADGGLEGKLEKSSSEYKAVSKSAKALLEVLAGQLHNENAAPARILSVNRKFEKFYTIHFDNNLDLVCGMSSGTFDSTRSMLISDAEMEHTRETLGPKFEGFTYLAISPRCVSIRSNIISRQFRRTRSNFTEVVLWKIYNKGSYSDLNQSEEGAYPEIKRLCSQIIEKLYPPEKDIGVKRQRSDQDDEEDSSTLESVIANGSVKKRQKKKDTSSS